ncbi:3-oxoacyl-ACP reductase FabG [Oxalobacteraceae bacterium OM1]|nr:3-oxoacyl-ACP reductase FabG [Oxalobacteraceae bacterium OM1]
MRPGQGARRPDQAHQWRPHRRSDRRSGFPRQSHGASEVNLENQVALVTGASRGIGRAIAVELAKQGAKVIGTATTEAGAAAITEYLTALRPDAGKGIVLNVTDAQACNSVIDQVQKEFGGLSILVNNAGITQDQLAMRMKDEEWDAVIATNLTAVGRLSRAVLRGMMKAKYGRIINITSVVGSAGNPGQMNYAAAKAGVAGMSRALAREIGSRNITVNCVAPGFIDTDMTRELGEQQVAALMQQIPAGRFGTPEDVAAAVGFLASPQAGYVTGTTLHVNGGMYMI